MTIQRSFLAIAASATFVSVASGDSDPRASLNLYLAEPTYSGCDDPVIDGVEATPCDEVVSPPANPGAPDVVFAWVFASHTEGFADGGGLGSVRFAVQYDASLTDASFALCSGGSWIIEDEFPASGAGIAVTYEGGCTEVPLNNVRVGYLTLVGTEGTVSLAADPRIGTARYTSCACETTFEFLPSLLGSVDITAGGAFACGSAVHTGEPATPEGSHQLDARPNPLGAATTVSFLAGTNAHAELRIFDAGGRSVRTLLEGPVTGGRHDVLWDGRDASGRRVPPGAYFYELRLDGARSATRKLILLR